MKETLSDTYRASDWKTGGDILALPVSMLELLAFCGQSVHQWRAEAIGRFVAVDEDAVGFYETLGQRCTY